MTGTRLLGLVPARGGSKGIPRKNLRPLGGKPLLAWTAEAAQDARGLDRLVLSTEDPEIADVGRACGLEVPFVRPATLAADDTPTLAVVQHALAELAATGGEYAAVCLLQPTNPFRTAATIEACLHRFARGDADCVLTVLPVPAEHHPWWVYLDDGAGALALSTGAAAPVARRQDLPAAWHREGSVYVSRVAAIERGSLYGDRVVGMAVDPSVAVNLDTMDDWERAEQLLQAGTVGR